LSVGTTPKEKMSTSSDEEDDNFLRIHAKAIAEALQQQDTNQASTSGAPQNQSQRERMIHDAYVALCHDDPRVESDLACQYLATALLDPNSPYALSGPLVEGIRQLCAKHQGGASEVKPPMESKSATETEESLSNNATSSSPKGSAMLAWAVYARIPLLCCQATNFSQVDAYLGSYRPPPPPNPLDLETETKNSVTHSILKQEEADRLAAMLSQASVAEAEESKQDETAKNGLDDEVWAEESDPSDFEFESGFSYEQQMTDFQDTFAAWMIDRSNPLKLSKPPAEGTNWKQVRHAVMDLTSQLNYRQVASLWTQEGIASANSLTGGRGPAELLKQFTMTLLIPPTTTTTTQNSRPSVFDSPDDEQDALQPQRQLQAMAWYPLWVLRDAASSTSSNVFSQYLTLLQTLLSVDAAAGNHSPAESMAPATYVGLASLSALCQKFASEVDHGSAANVERFRSLRQALWETSDDLSHALEQEEKFAKTADASRKNTNVHWILWTLLPIFEILTNQRLQTGATVVAKAESLAQRHHPQQTSQQWSSLLQSGLFRHWLLRLQALKGGDGEKSVLWHLMRRSLLYTIAQSMTATTALGKYAWRFPSFVAVVEIGAEAPDISSDVDVSSLPERFVDDILWHLLGMELAGGGASASAPTLQWKTTAKKPSTIKPLPSQAECQSYCWDGFHKLCASVVGVMNAICEEENRKENLVAGVDPALEKEGTSKSSGTKNKSQYQLVLRSFHRFVESLVACPLLAKLFVNDLDRIAPDPSKTIAKSLDAIQETLSQYKAPAQDTLASSRKAKDEDGEGKTIEEMESGRAKEQIQDASLQEDIHTVRKQLKVLRSMLSSKQTPGSSVAMTSLDVASSSKTD
jgi:hypothetical protein